MEHHGPYWFHTKAEGMHKAIEFEQRCRESRNSIHMSNVSYSSDFEEYVCEFEVHEIDQTNQEVAAGRAQVVKQATALGVRPSFNRFWLIDPTTQSSKWDQEERVWYLD